MGKNKLLQRKRKVIAHKIKALRKQKKFPQVELVERFSGSLEGLKGFELKNQISLESLLRLLWFRQGLVLLLL